MKVVKTLGNLLRKWLASLEGEDCSAQWTEPCRSKYCLKNFIHCTKCSGRVSAWFTPPGEKLWCRLCNTQTNWRSHEEYRSSQ